MTGGNRECIILDEYRIVKRTLRMIERPEFDVLDDFLYDDIDQQYSEGLALTYIYTYAPDEVKKFFPRLFGMHFIKVKKPTFSDTKLQTIYNYVASEDTTLEELMAFPEAQISHEMILEIERVLPFEQLPLEKQQVFFKKGINFHTFAKHTSPVVDSFALEKWLNKHQSKTWTQSMDYIYTVSNWGIREGDNHPVILDVGYFFFDWSIYHEGLKAKEEIDITLKL